MFSNQRPQGVTIPDQQLRSGERGTPNTVLHIFPLVPIGVQYCDEHGVQRSTVVYKMGDTVYFDRSAERWQAGLSEAADYIKDAVNAEHAAFLAPSAPMPDAVDVIADEESASAETPTP